MLPMDETLQYGGALLAALEALPPACPAAIYIRHAERDPIIDLVGSETVQLTPAGEEAARRFGARLPLSRAVRIVHSWIPRCELTARRIAEGFTAAGGRVTFDGMLDGLCGAFVHDFDRVVAYTREYNSDFTRRWFDGLLDPAVIDPCPIAAANMLKLAETALAGAAHDSLTILVSHDWDIMTLRETYLGARHEVAGWNDFLDGLALARDGETLHLRWREYAAERLVESLR